MGPRANQRGTCWLTSPLDRDERQARQGQPRGTVTLKSTLVVCSLHCLNPRESTPWHPTPLAGKGDITESMPRTSTWWVPLQALPACGGGAVIHTEPGLQRSGEVATRWTSVAGLTDQVPGSSPRGAPVTARKRGNVLLGSRAKAQHVWGSAYSIPLRVGVPTGRGVGAKLGWGTGTIRRLAGHVH